MDVVLSTLKAATMAFPRSQSTSIYSMVLVVASSNWRGSSSLSLKWSESFLPYNTMAQIEERIVAHAQRHGRVQRSQVESLSALSRDQAYRLLQRLVEQGKLKLVGRGRSAHFQPATAAPRSTTG